MRGYLERMMTNGRQVYAGALILLAGLLFYVTGHAELLSRLVPALMHDTPLSASRWLAFCHVIGMSLITAALLPASRRNAVLICAFWTFLHVLLELVEHPQISIWLSSRVPQWLHQFWLVEEGGRFVLRSSYDPRDLLLPLLAGAIAYHVITPKRRQDP
ncbi:MAG TPA: hypothetical protein VJ764_03975 [Steroidobacteraceae bacterium]|nr:hypothetical protein [Steroidobacteraceae bacterium]